MISVKKKFVLNKSQIGKKFRVENNNLDITVLIADSGYGSKKLNEIAYAHRKERDRRKTADDIIKYVQISDIDVHLGIIKSYQKVKGSEAPNNARRIMHYGDILVSTRRPTRGAVVAVPKEFDQEICTVFFTTLTVKNWDELDPKYLALFLRTSLGRFQFQSLITETAYPVISDDDVENMIVLIPSIDIQKELVAQYEKAVSEFFLKLNEAHASVAKARQTIEDKVLSKEAEVLEIPQFGLEEIVSENTLNEEVEQ